MYGFRVLDSRRHLPHFRISRMTSARGPFFAWRLVLDMERYISSFCPCTTTQLRVLSDTLTQTLRLFHQQGYYEQPRFHASFAWVLFDYLPQPTSPDIPEPPTPFSSFPPLRGPPKRKEKSCPHCPASTQDDCTSVERLILAKYLSTERVVPGCT